MTNNINAANWQEYRIRYTVNGILKSRRMWRGNEETLTREYAESVLRERDSDIIQILDISKVTEPTKNEEFVDLMAEAIDRSVNVKAKPKDAAVNSAQYQVILHNLFMIQEAISTAQSRITDLSDQLNEAYEKYNNLLDQQNATLLEFRDLNGWNK